MFCAGILESQPVFPKAAIFHQLTMQHGLSSDRIVEVLQDKEGFYWIATEDGVNRFDGSNVKVFRHNKNDSLTLSHNHCTDLMEDSKGNIWVATLDGLSCFIKEKEIFKRYYLAHPAFANDRLNWIREITEDGEGNIWIAAFGLWKLNLATNEFSYFYIQDASPEKSATRALSKVQYDKRLNGIWCDPIGSIGFFDIKKSSFFFNGNNPHNWTVLNIGEYSDYCIDTDHNMWVWLTGEKTLCKVPLPGGKTEYTGLKADKSISRLHRTNDGKIFISRFGAHPLVYDPQTRKADSSFMKRMHGLSPPTEIARKFYIDKDGNNWIGTSDGICILTPSEQSKEYTEFSMHGRIAEMAEEGFFGSSPQSENKTWLYSHHSIFCFDRNEGRFKNLDFPYLKDRISGLVVSGDSGLFIATVNAIYRYRLASNKIEKKFPGNFMGRTNMALDKFGQLWAVTWTNGVYKFDQDLRVRYHFLKTDSIANRQLRHNNGIAIYIPPGSDSVYIGYNGGKGYSAIHTQHNTVTSYIIPLARENERNVANTINCFLKDSKGNWWIGTFGGGLFQRNFRTQAFMAINQSDGLKSNFINGIVEDVQGNIWVSTSNGLNVLQNEGRIIISPDNEMVMGTNDFMGNLQQMEPESILAFNTKKLIVYHSRHVLEKEKPGKILISDFKIFDKLRPGSLHDKPIKLNYNQNFFSFSFSLLKSNPAREVLYALKLENFDNDWIYLKKLQEVRYTNIPPGQYVFKVKASGNNGEWLHFSKDIAITVLPPFWKTTWFRLLCIVAIASGIYILYRHRINQVRKVYEVRNKISQDLHDEIGSTLSGVVLFSELAQKKIGQQNTGEADTYLQRITQQSREMAEKMSDIVWAINPQNDNLKKVIAKLQSFAVNICNARGIRVHFEVDQAIVTRHMSMQQRKNIYMISKEAINNAVKYSGARNLFFSIHHKGSHFQLTIKDDGQGFDMSNTRKGNGMINMLTRADEMKSELQIESATGAGTLVMLRW